MSIPLISKIKPYNSGAFPVFEDVDGYGGYQVRTTIADRDSIPTLNRKIGMAVYVQADGYLYTLGAPGDNSNWIQSSDTSIFGDVTGSNIHSIVVGFQGRPISPAAPLPGMGLIWTGTAWTPEDLSGDASGSLLANTVTALQHNPIKPGLLGATQDGYVLTWINADGYWEAKINTIPVGTTTYFPFLSGVQTTNSTSLFVVLGAGEFNPLTQWPGAKSIKLQVLLETTAPVATVRLYNYTDTSVVTGSMLATSNTSTTLLTTGDLTANLTNGSAIYQVQFEMATGSGSDFITCSMARFVIQY